MTNNNPNPEKRHILLGLAVDVSGSMKQGILNKDNQNDNGFTAFRNSLKDLSKKIKQEQETVARENNGIIVSIDVFAQAFGLKEIENCDLLTLIEFGQEFVKQQEEDSQEKQNSSVSSSTKLGCQNIYYDPHIELLKIGCINGITNRSEFSGWLKKVFPNSEEAHSLVMRLYKYPRFAKYITGLLPKNWKESNAELLKYTFKQMGVTVESKLQKAKVLALEFANASEKEIRQIVIREIGDQMIKELPKCGNRLKPLEEVANMLESKEDVIEDLESLIYGNTPMRGALQVIQQRFQKELLNLPKDTISILFILSDGEPTDGDPLMYANQLKSSGINIISCFLTNKNITDPRKLFDKVESKWSKGAQLMFNMASPVDGKLELVKYLKKRKWEIPLHPKLFVQANHTDLLNEFMQTIISFCR